MGFSHHFSSDSTGDDTPVTSNFAECLPPIPTNSKRLFLIRHGEVINPGGDKPVFYGCLDVKLSPLGELEAKAAGDYLRQFNIQNVASSPLTRAKFGAREILSRQEDNDKNVIVFDGFTEMDRGEWCGKTKEEIGEDMMEQFNACDENVTPEGGESYNDLVERVIAARNELLKKTDDGNMSAIVSHLQVTRSILRDALDIPVDQISTLEVATASITVIDYDSVSGTQTVHVQSFKPDAGLRKSVDGAN